MQVFWHERLQRDACSALLYHTATPSNSKFWLSKSSQSLPHDICGEDSFSEMLDFIGAPGEIRTPDPQIRSLVLYPAELRALIPLPGNRAAEPRDSYRLGVSLARVAGVNADLPCSVWAQASAWFSTRMRVASSLALAGEKTSANSGNPSASGTTAISATTTT